MKIAPYYQKLLEDALQAAKSLEPITFIGMFDSGIDYLFNLAEPFFTAELSSDIKPVFIDLSGLSTGEEIVNELHFLLTDHLKTKIKPDYLNLTKTIKEFAQHKKIVFVVYFGQEGTIDTGFFQFVNRLRNLLGWKFSYCFLASTRLSQKLKSPIVDKILKRNVVPVLPLVIRDAEVVLRNYEERYNQKVSVSQMLQIIQLSGGNPGLIKALYLQVKQNKTWNKPELKEEQLFFRLKGITADLTKNAQDMIVGKNHSTDAMMEYMLIRYGYAQKEGKKLTAFTSIFTDFLRLHPDDAPMPPYPEAHVDQALLHLTKSQRIVLKFLENHVGELVTKDAIAQVLWGDEWANKYSDWAIDQLISTLREKMATMKYQGKIVTKKGEGLVLLQK